MPCPPRRSPLRFLLRAARLRCPECGVSPVFTPLARTRSWQAWATPLDGCPRCRYPYEREPGYFLPAIWIVHAFTVSAFGLLLALTLDTTLHPPLAVLTPTACIPTAMFAVAFVRHAITIYLAFDHLISPQAKPADPPAGGGN